MGGGVHLGEGVASIRLLDEQGGGQEEEEEIRTAVEVCDTTGRRTQCTHFVCHADYWMGSLSLSVDTIRTLAMRQRQIQALRVEVEVTRVSIVAGLVFPDDTASVAVVPPLSPGINNPRIITITQLADTQVCPEGASLLYFNTTLAWTRGGEEPRRQLGAIIIQSLCITHPKDGSRWHHRAGTRDVCAASM